MSNELSLNEIVEQAVTSQVQSLLDNSELLSKIESQVVDSIQQRIVAKFANISSVPDLVKTVQNSVENMFDRGQVPGIDSFVDHGKIQSAVDNAVQQLVNSTIDNLVVDPAWIGKIENIVNVNMSSKLGQQLKNFDINQAIVKEIDAGVERWQERLKKDFKTNGIIDSAESTQITIGNEGVVLSGTTVVTDAEITNNIVVSNNASVNGTLEVENLVLRGRINTDNASWNELVTVISGQIVQVLDAQWKTNMVDSVLDQAKDSGIDFGRVRVDGHYLIQDNRLSPKITETNIETVGTLKNLATRGPVDLSGTVHVVNNRLGINTKRPEMVLSVWDEEVCIVAGKIEQKHAFIGTSRQHELSIGVNRETAIKIDTDGVTAVKHLLVDRFRIGHAASTPGHSGTRGDFLFNSDPKPGQPFAWTCLGGFKWQPLFSSR